MPTPREVKKKFGIPSEGDVFYGYRTIDSEMEHDVIVRYEKYRLPFMVVLFGNGDQSKINEIFRKGRTTRVKTRYGHVYECEITDIHEHGNRNQKKLSISGDILCKKIM